MAVPWQVAQSTYSRTSLTFRAAPERGMEGEANRFCQAINSHLKYPAGEHLVDMLCHKCTDTLPHLVTQTKYHTYPWLLDLICGGCSTTWHLCKDCPPPMFRTGIHKKRVLAKNKKKEVVFNSHNSDHHSIATPAEDSPNYFDESLSSFNNNHNDSLARSTTVEAAQHGNAAWEHSAIPMEEGTLRIIESIFCQENGMRGGVEYILAELQYSRGAGMQSVVARSLTGATQHSVVSIEDARLHIMMARQFLRQTRNERQHSVEILSMINNSYQAERESLETQMKALSERLSQLTKEDAQEVQSPNELPSPPQRPRVMRPVAIPTSPNEARRYLEGTDSVLALIPCPIVYTLDDGYAYVKVQSVLAFALAMGIPTPLNTPGMDLEAPRSVYNTPAFQKILRICGIPPHGRNTVALGIWLDGMDAGGSNKNNRGGLKATSMTSECPPPHRGIFHTLPLAVGRDDADHSVYQQILNEELQALTKPNWYYDGILQRPALYRFVHLSTICDRPEVSDVTGIGHHKGMWSLLPGVSAPIVVAPPHPNRKMSALVKRQLSSCEECYAKRCGLIGNPSVSCISVSDCDNCCDWNLELTEYKVTTKDFKMPEEERGEDGWISSQRITFKSIRVAAKKAFERARDQVWSQPECISYLRSRFQLSPKTAGGIYEASQEDDADEFNEECLPAAARSTATIEFENVIPGIMHLLFLGIAKTILSLVVDTLKKHMGYAPFLRTAQNLLKDIRSLSLQYCRVWIFGSSLSPTGPWVSENCLGFTRVMKSVYSLLNSLLVKDDAALGLCHKATWSYVAVVARIMQNKYDDNLIDETECYLKIFLSQFEDLDAYVRGDTKRIPKAETTGNLVYLLRLPDMMRRYGPLREFWEGSIRGEGIFRILKPLVRRGVHNPGVPSALLSKFYSDLSLSWILKNSEEGSEYSPELDQEDTGDFIDPTSHFLRMAKRYTDVHCYRGVVNLQKSLEEGRCISLVERSRQFYAKCRVSHLETKLIRVHLQPVTGVVASLLTFKVVISPGVRTFDMAALDNTFEPCSGIPVRTGMEDEWNMQCTYYMIQPNWMDLQEDLTWRLPSLYDAST